MDGRSTLILLVVGCVLLIAVEAQFDRNRPGSGFLYPENIPGRPGGRPGGNPGGRPGGVPGGRPGDRPGGRPGGRPDGRPDGRPTNRPSDQGCSCPTTTEYNPVCGTDGVSYSNPGKLNCAKTCGRNTSLLHYGNCTPADPNAPSSTTTAAPSSPNPNTRRRG